MTDPHDTPMSPRTEILHVRVVEQSCRMSTAGTKTFRTIKHFVIRVRDDFGNERDIMLPEELYEAFEVGQVGTLTLTDGEVFSFELDGDRDETTQGDELPWPPSFV